MDRQHFVGRAGGVGRRAVIAMLGAALLRPRAARAQAVRHLGVLMPTSEDDAETAELGEVFRRALDDLGWSGGRNLRFDYRWGNGDARRIDALAGALVATAPDAILAGGAPAVAPLQRATSTIPIVFVSATDPVAQGFVESLDHPGGNITGFTNFEPGMGGKWLSILREIAPKVTHAAMLYNPATAPYADSFLKALAAAAPASGIATEAATVRNDAGIERVVAALAQKSGALVVPSDAFTLTHAYAVIASAAKHRVPAIYAFEVFTANGGLASYGVDLAEEMRQAAKYIDRILSGDKPSDLPVLPPSRYKLALNLKTASALGLTVPPQLLASADEVIE